MSVHASLIEHTFLGVLSLYVVTECALTIMQTRAAEKACTKVPAGFETKMSLAGVRKAADYTGELAQANLLLTIAGAGFALLMTYGHGLNVLTALTQVAFGHNLFGQWVLLNVIVLLMLLIELPFGWWARFRVKERYGYMREPRIHWLRRTLSEALWGWLLFMPASALLLLLFEYTGSRWWFAAWCIWCAYLIWRWAFAGAKGIYWHRRSVPFDNEDTKTAVNAYLAKQGLRMKNMLVMTRPASWDHSNIVLSGWGLSRTVVVFAHVAKLPKEELLAIIAHEAGHVRHGHAFIRFILQMGTSLAFCALAGWGAKSIEFFTGFNYSPLLTYYMGGTHAGYVCALALVTFPMLLYPVSAFLNAVYHELQYDADRYAAKTAGRAAIRAALVHLHRDYSTSLTPSRLYSLFHYRRPHAGMRVARLNKLKNIVEHVSF